MKQHLKLVPPIEKPQHPFIKENDVLFLDEYALINPTEKTAKTPFPCFINSDAFEVAVIEEEPVVLLPMISEDFDEYTAGERESYIISHQYHFEHEDNIFLIRLNDNMYPSGHWVLVQIRIIETSLPEAPLAGLVPGYSLVEIDRLSFDDQ